MTYFVASTEFLLFSFFRKKYKKKTLATLANNYELATFREYAKRSRFSLKARFLFLILNSNILPDSYSCG